MNYPLGPLVTSPAPVILDASFPLHQRVRAAIPEVLRLWEARVRAEVLPARHQSAPALLNGLPGYLEELARTLTPRDPTPAEGAQEIAVEHGRQRAYLVDYSLDEILQEWKLLRQTLFAVLERDDVLPVEARDQLLDLIEEAARRTAVEFMEIQQAALQETDIRKNRFLHTLAAITNATYLLAQIGSSEPREAKQRTIIQRQVGRLSRLVSDLMEAPGSFGASWNSKRSQ